MTKVCKECNLEFNDHDWGRLCSKCKYIKYRQKRLDRYANSRELVNRLTVDSLHIRRFGLDPDTRQAIVDAQGGICPICQRKRKLVVDHKHGTNIVRGLICATCNRALGYLMDDYQTISRAAEYINKDGDIL
jgi:hypothetical protein